MEMVSKHCLYDILHYKKDGAPGGWRKLSYGDGSEFIGVPDNSGGVGFDGRDRGNGFIEVFNDSVSWAEWIIIWGLCFHGSIMSKSL